MKAKIITLTFLLFIFGFGIAGLVLDDREFSDMENRLLAQSPEVTYDAVMKGEFQDKLESYLSDQMPMRDGLYSLKVDYERLMMKTYQNGVYFADDGYLIQEYKENPAQISRNVQYINDFAQNVDVPITFMLVPTATAILSDKLPAGCLNDDQMKSIDKVRESLDSKINLVVPDKKLREKAEDGEQQLFYRTDHHWTDYGAAYGYYELYQALMPERAAADLSAGGAIHTDDKGYEFYGTLYSKAPSAFQQADTFYLPSHLARKCYVTFAKKQEDPGTLVGMYDLTKLETKDKYAALFGGNFSHFTIHSDAGNKERILVIKDSYANAVLPYLAEIYSEIDVIDMRYYHMEQQTVSELIKSEGVSQVVLLYNMDFFNSDNNFLWLD